MLCPCHSGKSYDTCCAPFHEGRLPEKAVQLMRSRYTAYALGKVDYIIDTTHSNHPDSQVSIEERKKSIAFFSEQTQFINLEIKEIIEEEEVSFVTFRATLVQGGRDCSFTEKSRFEKIAGKWFYRAGEIE